MERMVWKTELISLVEFQTIETAEKKATMRQDKFVLDRAASKSLDLTPSFAPTHVVYRLLKLTCFKL
jgi:hypothetical protein